MYKDYEIEGIRKTWVSWLAEFAVGQSKVADLKDRSRISVSISNNFHKKGIAKFITKKSKENEGELIVTRVE